MELKKMEEEKMELYKAKRIVDGKWVYGDLLSISSNRKYIVTSVDEHEAAGPGETFWIDCLCTLIDPDTVCKFTGIYDCTEWSQLSYLEQIEFLDSWNWQEKRKNNAEDWKGRMIWDNDIVQFKHSRIYTGSYFRNYKIEYVNSSCRFGLRFINGSIHFPCKAGTVKMNAVRVIGNVFDDPDLLQKGKYGYLPLYERLKEADQIEDDEEACEREYELACEFFEENDYLLTEKDMATVRSRGLEESFEVRKAIYLERLWSEFGDVPMDPETECIESEWHGFPAGTHREIIWHWFEETYDVSVARDLMNV